MGLLSSTRQPHTRCALSCTAGRVEGGEGRGGEGRGGEGRGGEGSGWEGRGGEGRGRRGEGRGGEGRGGEGRGGEGRLRMRSCEEQFTFYKTVIDQLMCQCFPNKVVTRHSADKLWVTNGFRALVRKRHVWISCAS